MAFDSSIFEEYTKWVVSEVEPGFIHVQYNNPKTLNAFTEEDWRAYHAILDWLDSDPSTNIILISSKVEKAFSSGLNLKAAMSLMNGKEDWSFENKKKFMYKHIIDFQDAITKPARMSTPTIALLNGVSYGLALDIASACTIRLAVEGVKMSIREIKIGIVADMGSLQRMTNLVNNKSKMYQLALTGDVFGAKDALDLGFVSEVVPDLKTGVERCLELGSSINGNAQWAIKGTKDSIQYMVNGGTHEQGLANIAEYNSINLVGGITAGMPPKL
ncbi:hypothetical protein FT663_00478 [Candidozyma haemuli var. vulneris]|uniref:Enoyl-CoA hydratase n=1 Tax=Candidozyma haemuli TaxID=45357 RepID=A0A2V1ASH6_9ASCO|nr:hypothetical protein CXQ85_002257 [[Candida] haemuloni]KAF3993455.1 hypothetical protein FT662_00584 [[Candida] haemuloni var. vulneris]KAF3995425.1 hypothetical protein FT663_00478 [[Candida] haemuloni var. vulneris]PVH20466.1 hypothetical protein CXQ85_002257 [[Candida] haemuloni]